MNSVATQTDFHVPSHMLWPSVCPACEYSWQGLEQARCPECGEQVSEDEVVIVGRWMINKDARYTGEHWRRELLSAAASALLGWILLYFLHPHDIVAITAIAAGLFLLLSAIILATAAIRRRIGWPAGVLRLTPLGFQRGAGPRKGMLRPWKPSVRVVVEYREGRLRLKAYRKWNRIYLWALFDLEFEVGEPLREGVMERLRAWSTHQV